MSICAADPPATDDRKTSPEVLKTALWFAHNLQHTDWLGLFYHAINDISKEDRKALSKLGAVRIAQLDSTLRVKHFFPTDLKWKSATTKTVYGDPKNKPYAQVFDRLLASCADTATPKDYRQRSLLGLSNGKKGDLLECILATAYIILDNDELKDVSLAARATVRGARHQLEKCVAHVLMTGASQATDELFHALPTATAIEDADCHDDNKLDTETKTDEYNVQSPPPLQSRRVDQPEKPSACQRASCTTNEQTHIPRQDTRIDEAQDDNITRRKFSEWKKAKGLSQREKPEQRKTSTWCPKTLPRVSTKTDTTTTQRRQTSQCRPAASHLSKQHIKCRGGVRLPAWMYDEDARKERCKQFGNLKLPTWMRATDARTAHSSSSISRSSSSTSANRPEARWHWQHDSKRARSR